MNDPNFIQGGVQEFEQSQCQNRGRSGTIQFVSTVWYISFSVPDVMANLQNYINALNTNAAAIMALMTYNTNLINQYWAYSYDFGIFPLPFNINNSTVIGGTGPPPLFNTSAMESSPYGPGATEAIALAALDAAVKNLQFMWIYYPQYPVGTSATLQMADKHINPTGIPPGLTTMNIYSVAPPAGTNGTPTVGSVFKIPFPTYKGIGYYGTGPYLALFVQENTIISIP